MTDDQSIEIVTWFSGLMTRMTAEQRAALRRAIEPLDPTVVRARLKAFAESAEEFNLAACLSAARGSVAVGNVARTTAYIAELHTAADAAEAHWNHVFGVIAATPADELAAATAEAIAAAPAALRASLAKWDARTSRPLAALIYPMLAAREAAHA